MIVAWFIVLFLVFSIFLSASWMLGESSKTGNSKTQFISVVSFLITGLSLIFLLSSRDRVDPTRVTSFSNTFAVKNFRVFEGINTIAFFGTKGEYAECKFQNVSVSFNKKNLNGTHVQTTEYLLNSLFSGGFVNRTEILVSTDADEKKWNLFLLENSIPRSVVPADF